MIVVLYIGGPDARERHRRWPGALPEALGGLPQGAYLILTILSTRNGVTLSTHSIRCSILMILPLGGPPPPRGSALTILMIMIFILQANHHNTKIQLYICILYV